MDVVAEPRRQGRPPITPEAKVRVCVLIGEYQNQALKDVTIQTGIPRSELIRRAIEAMLTPREVRA